MRLEFVRDIRVSWGDMTAITIEMEYLGGILSVNRFKYQGRYTRPETKKWMAELALSIKMTCNYAEVRFKPPVKVRIGGIFRDRRSTPDLHNLAKPILDSIEQAIEINDKDFLLETGEPMVDKAQDPHLTITISQA